MAETGVKSVDTGAKLAGAGADLAETGAKLAVTSTVWAGTPPDTAEVPAAAGAIVNTVRVADEICPAPLGHVDER